MKAVRWNLEIDGREFVVVRTNDKVGDYPHEWWVSMVVPGGSVRPAITVVGGGKKKVRRAAKKLCRDYEIYRAQHDSIRRQEKAWREPEIFEEG